MSHVACICMHTLMTTSTIKVNFIDKHFLYIHVKLVQFYNQVLLQEET